LQDCLGLQKMIADPWAEMRLVLQSTQRNQVLYRANQMSPFFDWLTTSMRRPSLIRVDVKGEAVRISGRCVVSGEGKLRIHGEPSQP
jgi:hypothetical protein